MIAELIEKAQLTWTDAEKDRLTSRHTITVTVKKILQQGSESGSEDAEGRATLTQKLAILCSEIGMKCAGTENGSNLEKLSEEEPEKSLNELQKRWKTGTLSKEKVLEIITGEICYCSVQVPS